MKDSTIVLISLIIIASTLITLAATTQINVGLLDNYSRYYQSKNCFQSPELFFLRWGRPLFLLLSHPFSALLGLFGLKLFNIICCLGAAYITYLCAKKLSLPRPWLAFVLVALSPYAFFGALSALTDMLFLLIVVSVYYLFLSKKYLAASIISSFSFLSRDEGVILMALVFFALLAKKKWRQAIAIFAFPSVFMIINLILFPNTLYILDKAYGAVPVLPLTTIFTKHLCDRVLFDINNLFQLVGPFILGAFLIGAASRKIRIELLIVALGIGFYTFVRIAQLMGVGEIMRYEIFLIPFIVLICLHGFASKPKHVLPIMVAFIVLSLPCFKIINLIALVFAGIIYFFYRSKKVLILLLLIGTGIYLGVEASRLNTDQDLEISESIVSYLHTRGLENKTIFFNLLPIAYVEGLQYPNQDNFHYYYYIRNNHLYNLSSGTILIHVKGLNDFDPQDTIENTTLFRKLATFSHVGVFQKR